MRWTLRLLGVAAVTAMPLTADAEVLWRGDFEAGNVSEWSRALNGRGITIVDDPVVSGKKAAKITITSADLWSNGLNRVELNYGPPRARTANGAETYFGWHFYIPKPLVNSGHQIGYWETGGPYKQLMSFSVRDDNIDFSTRLPSNKRHWAGKVSAGRWHHIAMHIKWGMQGAVSVWFDGQLVVDKGAAQTTYMGAAAFVQVGILRGNKSDPPEVIYIDGAAEGSSLSDVLTPAAPADAGLTTSADAGTNNRDFGAEVRQPERADAAAALPEQTPERPKGTDAGSPMPEEDPSPDQEPRTQPSGCTLAAETRVGAGPLILVVLAVLRRRRPA